MGFHGFSGHIWLPEGKWSKIFIWCQESGAQLPEARDLENRRNGHPMFHYRIGMNPWCLWMFMDAYGDSWSMFGPGILKKKRHLPCWSKMRRYPGCQRWSPWMVSQTAQLLRWAREQPLEVIQGEEINGNSAASWDLIGFYRVISIHILISQSYSGSKNLYLSDQPSHSSKGKGWTPQKRNR